MFDSKFHGYQSMKLQLTYEITFGCVQKLQIAHLIPLQTINIVSYNKFYKPRPGLAWQVFRLDRRCVSICQSVHLSNTKGLTKRRRARRRVIEGCEICLVLQTHWCSICYI